MIVPLPALLPNNVAGITGSAFGIGLAAALRFARLKGRSGKPPYILCPDNDVPKANSQKPPALLSGT